MQVEGINGVKGTSQEIYRKINDNLHPDRLQIPTSTNIYSDDTSNKCLRFRYSMQDNTCPKHLQDAKLRLESTSYDDSDNGLGTTFNQQQKLSVEYDLTFDKVSTSFFSILYLLHSLS